jgi:hypothetical protein
MRQNHRMGFVMFGRNDNDDTLSKRKCGDIPDVQAPTDSSPIYSPVTPPATYLLPWIANAERYHLQEGGVVSPVVCSVPLSALISNHVLDDEETRSMPWNQPPPLTISESHPLAEFTNSDEEMYMESADVDSYRSEHNAGDLAANVEAGWISALTDAANDAAGDICDEPIIDETCASQEEAKAKPVPANKTGEATYCLLLLLLLLLILLLFPHCVVFRTVRPLETLCTFPRCLREECRPALFPPNSLNIPCDPSKFPELCSLNVPCVFNIP